MTPISPIVKGFEHLEVVFAKNQPEYIPLPALPVDDSQRIITRWKLTWKERVAILFGRHIFLWVSTFGNKLQPVMLTCDKPAVSAQE